MSVSVDLRSVVSGVAVLALEGKIFGPQANSLHQQLEILTGARVQKIVIDCSKAEYICSDACQVIGRVAAACRINNGDVRLAAVTPFVLQTFRALGLVDTLTICSNRQLAVMTFTSTLGEADRS